MSLSCVKGFVIKNFLPLGFLVSIIWMIVWPWPGEKVDSWRVCLSSCVFCRFLTLTQFHTASKGCCLHLHALANHC